MASRTNRPSRIDVPAPPGLSARRLDARGAELVLFSWDVAAPAAGALDLLAGAERDVLERVARGCSNDDIARARGTSVRTVANQVASILRKLGAGSRLELIRRYG